MSAMMPPLHARLPPSPAHLLTCIQFSLALPLPYTCLRSPLPFPYMHAVPFTTLSLPCPPLPSPCLPPHTSPSVCSTVTCRPRQLVTIMLVKARHSLHALHTDWLHSAWKVLADGLKVCLWMWVSVYHLVSYTTCGFSMHNIQKNFQVHILMFKVTQYSQPNLISS